MQLRVENHCIETAAKSAHQQIQFSLLNADPAASEFRENTEAYQLLNDFILRTDFAKLRSARPELAGGHTIEVELKRNPSNRNEFEILVVSRTPEKATPF